jgi:transposase InsO family protein
MKFIYDIDGHPRRAEIEKRLEILKFFDEFGVDATRRAFGKGRSTIFLWKRRLKISGGKLTALAPGNKTPLHKRKRIVHPFIEEFIIKYRSSHPRADKTTITPALATACGSQGIRPISESTVGRIIHDLKGKGRLSRSNKVTINGRTEKLMSRGPKRPRKKTRRNGFPAENPGDIVQMDTVSIFVDGIKRYIFTAIDIKTRFAFACSYRSSSSANGSDFLRKFMHISPFATSRVQTDNGSEFEKHFDKACQEQGLVHFFNYPKHPQSNSLLERFNRTIQEQFVNWHIDDIEETDIFNRDLMEYLIWYNTEKPHRGIGNVPPLRYYVDNFLIPPQKSNMLWTLTWGLTKEQMFCILVRRTLVCNTFV